MKLKAVIVDMDGTIANVEHRRHFITGEHKDWRSFNESCRTDTANQWCVDLVKMLQKEYHIIIVSGRNHEFKEHTEDWLADHDIYPSRLFVRGPKDSRNDSIIKEEIYKTFIEPNFDVAFCIDDRQRVVDMWRSLGLVCLQCDVGNF